MSASYDEVRAASLADPDAFWLGAAAAIDWDTPPDRGWVEGEGWFAGARLNTCRNAVDRHVEAGRGGDTAVIYESPVTGTRRLISFAELRDAVARTAGMLAALGVTKGDRVVIYMPMIPETLFAMLACARLGAVHSVVFGGFAPPELAKRVDDATPKILLTASCGIEGSRIVPYKPLVDEALELARHPIDHVVLLQRDACEASMTAARDLDWAEAFAGAAPAPCVPVAATDPLYILYTSGTTGTPKGVVRQNGGHAVALAWSMANIYGVHPGDTFWAASDVGWVVGHSYIVYGPLLAGCTTLLFEGKPVGTPDAGTFWRTIVDHDVDVFFTAPTAIRAIRKEDPDGGFIDATGTGRLKAMFLAGERADPSTIEWAERHLKLPVIDHWWQTELGWPAIATCFGLGDTRRRAGSAGFPVPGFRFALFDEAGRGADNANDGRLAIKAPLPPGCFSTLWNNEAGYARSFESFPGFYETGDAGHIDGDGFLHIMGRTDDIINVAGHRLSTGQIEEIIAGHPAIAECAVVGADDRIKGMVPCAFAVVKSGASRNDQLASEIIARVRGELGPVAALKRVCIVDVLPKTRSGKILRAVIRRLVNGEDVDAPPTIENPDALIAIRASLRGTS
ncbi:AMP-binding protein [Sphingopyxis sp. XHP0097]|uniref:AMP-binding protein n=1 Tax=Sphingopyxis jiangsuensis TaxID=2871171 RepID=A0ABS7MGJ8_9SPHN|nr:MULTISPECIES: AMP-binding protein [Sphingopyxis]MBY4638083.1 AMP-binding protein [Sphingopyxis jiangsuensis]